MRRLPTPAFQAPRPLAGARRPAAPSLPARRGGAARAPSRDRRRRLRRRLPARRRSAGFSTTMSVARARPTRGWVQMYIRDPSGNLVEIDWPDVSTLDPEIVAELGRLEDEYRRRGARARRRFTRGRGVALTADAEHTGSRRPSAASDADRRCLRWLPLRLPSSGCLSGPRRAVHAATGDHLRSAVS